MFDSRFAALQKKIGKDKEHE